MEIENIRIINAECLLGLKEFAENYFDSIVTDPPYGLSFMGKHWDYEIPSVEIWAECLRVLKPGGHLLCFAGTRTQHRMACRIEDAGFEIRDMIAWVYGSGFPKSLNIGKAVDKLQGNEREEVGERHRNVKPYDDKNGDWNSNNTTGDFIYTKGTSEFEGWGTALKPALEPITLARKPLSEKSVAENVLRWGTGGINIDECRVEINPEVDDMLREVKREKRQTETWENGSGFKNETNSLTGVPENGRFPANLIHDGSEEVLELFPETKSKGHYSYKFPKDGGLYNLGHNDLEDKGYSNDSGSAARFFYCAKASKSERNDNLDLELKPITINENLHNNAPLGRETIYRNNHPTVKPIKLMEYLVKLVTPKNGIVLDPFGGTFTTMIACDNLGFKGVSFEREEEYFKIGKARLIKKQTRLAI